MVHAKAQLTEKARRFRDDLWELFATYFYEETDGLEEFNFDADSPEAPHFPILIPLDGAFADWDPVRSPENLVDSYYSRTFGDLISYIDDLLNIENADAEE